MRQEERKAILGQGIVVPETPRRRRQLTGLAEDVASSPLAGRRLPLRLRNFRPTTEGYLASLGGPLPYMVRLREIDAMSARHTAALEGAWRGLAGEEADAARFESRWRTLVGRWSFDEVNDLIGRHNRYALVPVEVRFHTDPEGFPGLLSGDVSPQAFVKRMRGFWWKGFQTRRFRGMSIG